MLRRVFLALAASVVLAGCANESPPDASPVEVMRRAYVPDGPAELTLYTVRSVKHNDGAHTALLISGSQTVLWDPSGSFEHPAVPEVDDVLYGMTPRMQLVYVDYHVRPEYYVMEQKLTVDRATADRLIALAEARGAAPKSTCARSTSTILREAGLPVRATWFPEGVQAQFGKIPGATTRKVDMSNVDTSHGVLYGHNGVPNPPGT
ncbi:hypothetical protein [Palleronia caenipelagi]|uniref:Lipoprotein n=1 Tax=Palleronia caenipelagi TaxID=2489174 RepID=A0A547Q2U3_9RHOB|nr:hypothetical protein [Palleronia caenipelagi]TRD20707.1 hypothetical protein FEV53_09690 [Palleronia caenipelagi]